MLLLHVILYVASARTNNLEEHYDWVHLKIRPWPCPVAKCPKTREGYRRKADLHVHIKKNHPDWSVKQEEE